MSFIAQLKSSSLLVFYASRKNGWVTWAEIADSRAWWQEVFQVKRFQGINEASNLAILLRLN